ncbi:acetylornithine deacetylase [Rhizobium mesoamericanum]|uniref:acetylornithine deacetylase n=1 Tax=Rhizobium mesoamericanum TaxID=1079800 RepID=UPI002783D090|nr:acetylornithine deacetylase [Rhizobium mesoamericanum]MDQ0561092.1 acetylornithine deacetylase [Rhizobium mesoamericanum]
MANAREILEKLIGFPSVVGSANAPIVSYIRDYFAALGAHVSELPGPEGNRSNLFVSMGPRDRAGIILSGHTDVVPIEGQPWTSPAFALRQGGDRLYGRGTSDMKRFLAAAMAVAAGVNAEKLRRPLHFAFSYDEEAGCRGVPHMIEAIPSICALPASCIVGEPSQMIPILAHKGKAAVKFTVEGTAGHSSRPDRGLNAIHGLSTLLAKAVAQSDLLKHKQQNELFLPSYSTLQVGVIEGGLSLNVIPQFASFDVEVRAIPGAEPYSLLEPIFKAFPELEKVGLKVKADRLSEYPGMELPEDSDLATLMTRATGRNPIRAVSYGTEAGLFAKTGIPSIICGPGNVDRAHKVDEYILLSELNECCSVLDRIASDLAA